MYTKQTAFDTIYDELTGLGYLVMAETSNITGLVDTLYVYKGEEYKGIHVNLYNNRMHFFLGKDRDEASIILMYADIEKMSFVGRLFPALSIDLKGGSSVFFQL